MNAETLKDLLANATPGPWTATHNDHYWQIDSERHSQIGDACASNQIYPDGGDLLGVEKTAVIAAANAKLFAFAPQLAAEVIRLREASENLLIAIGMGWDLDGVIEQMKTALSETPEHRATPSQ